MKKSIPTEDQESFAFAEMLRLKRYLFSHIANEMQGTWGARIRNKRMGMTRGFPDYAILKKNELVFVEMKRQSGGKVSDEQQAWIDGLNRIGGVRAGVCRGAEEAIRFVKSRSK